MSCGSFNICNVFMIVEGCQYYLEIMEFHLIARGVNNFPAQLEGLSGRHSGDKM